MLVTDQFKARVIVREIVEEESWLVVDSNCQVCSDQNLLFLVWIPVVDWTGNNLLKHQCFIVYFVGFVLLSYRSVLIIWLLQIDQYESFLRIVDERPWRSCSFTEAELRTRSAALGLLLGLDVYYTTADAAESVVVPLVRSSNDRRNKRQYEKVCREADSYIVQHLYTPSDRTSSFFRYS